MSWSMCQSLDAKTRRKILGIHTKKMPLADDVQLDDLAERNRAVHGRGPRRFSHVELG